VRILRTVQEGWGGGGARGGRPALA